MVEWQTLNSGEEKPSDKVRDTAEAPVTFKSDGWNCFGFPVSRNERVEKVMDGQKNNMQTLTDKS